jgi:hypothetical protein
MGLGRVVVSQGRCLRPLECYVALVVVCPSTYDDGVRGCTGLYMFLSGSCHGGCTNHVACIGGSGNFA